ncbi:hypothetical protein J437_LFUL003752 [Ladona fulva]|uniref:Uncharacterized protein n=1 Tax=Ladona fulva TaxID=123851 RepID=A0A8K0JWY1_LADFU|nr:hypothetical protein J437_LFUL003752 [Ladona fulva]
MPAKIALYIARTKIKHQGHSMRHGKRESLAEQGSQLLLKPQFPQRVIYTELEYWTTRDTKSMIPGERTVGEAACVRAAARVETADFPGDAEFTLLGLFTGVAGEVSADS